MKNIYLTDKELSKLNIDEFYLYLILKSSQHLNLENIFYFGIKEIFHKDISNNQIDNLLKSLIKKNIVKPDEFIISKEHNEKIIISR